MKTTFFTTFPPLAMLALNLHAETFTFSTLAGPIGYADGTGSAGRFYNPTSVAVDSSTNVYVADFVNNVIRQISQVGTNLVVTTLAGTPGAFGTNDAQGFAARFNNPTGVAVDKSNNVYVADFQNDAIRKIDAAGLVTTLAGLAGTSGTNDGIGGAARFNQPYGLVVDASGNIYVADTFNHTIRKISTAAEVSTVAGQAGIPGTNNGPSAVAQFDHPTGVALDSSNNIYVADNFNNTIRKITPAGVVSTWAGLPTITGTNNGTGSAARFHSPTGLTIDKSNNVYVADYGNQTIRKITRTAVVSTFAGAATKFGSVDGTGSSARFDGPNGVAIDAGGNLYVADNGNSTIRKITPAAVTSTFAGRTGGSGTNDGTGSAARFFSPNNVAADSSNNLFVADEGNQTIRKITPAGVVTTFAGLAGVPGSVNGTGSAARFHRPEGVAVDRSNNVYVADQINNTIRKITPAAVVTTLAGLAGATGSTDGTNSAARFNVPSSVTVDFSGNIYVTDYGNNTIRKIRPVGKNWVVTTIAGIPGATGSSDGTNTDALFNSPYGVAVDSSTNLYVADAGNDTIRKLTPVGTNWVVTTVAGQVGVIGSADGTNSDALFNLPNAVAVDSSGNVYVGDSSNFTIRKMTPVGTNWVVTTLGGLATKFGNVDGTGSTARFSSTFGVAVDKTGNLYVPDYDNNCIRKGMPTTSLPPVVLRSPRLNNGEFSFGITGASGLRIEIQTAISLPNWHTVTSYILEGGTNYFNGEAQSQPNQFYQVAVP